MRAANSIHETPPFIVAEASAREPAPGVRHRLTVSVGVSRTSDDVDTPELLLHTSDLALYEAKRRGRDLVEFAPMVPVNRAG